MRIKVDENGNWRSFRHRNFRILYPANAASNIGTWAQRVAQDWLVLELTNNNGFYLGLVTAIQFAPVLLFSLQGGAMADRVGNGLRQGRHPSGTEAERLGRVLRGIASQLEA